MKTLNLPVHFSEKNFYVAPNLPDYFLDCNLPLSGEIYNRPSHTKI